MSQGHTSSPPRIAAVLGPTNTGKTSYAVERMLGHKSGIIGLPLRLLAREVYDRIVELRGPSVVALVTGEERIVPPKTQYWVCTVEAMPEGLGCDFLAVDEIQLCADPERGHVFTDRLLRARGKLETLFLGADTMREPIAELVPEAQFIRRERMSELVYAGAKKISRMRPRSAIVVFSVDSVYAIAELIRRQRGGAAVVMGALSPRTRNAQVAMYQEGEVDFLVATDAIGMGLNLDIDHVAFAATHKFDGRRMRALAPNELAQIAGRAGRGMKNGSFGVTGDAPALDSEVARAITTHRFTPIRKLLWRNSNLSFGSGDALVASLESAPEHPLLVRGREADDVLALKALLETAEIRARASTPDAVKQLWDICRIPDFRGISLAEHVNLLSAIYTRIHEDGQLSGSWIERQIRRTDQLDGGIDTIAKRLAFIRSWTYVTQRKGWVEDESHWRDEARAVEDRLSDALHTKLMQRFVDRRTSVLLRRLGQKEAIVAQVSEAGEVTIDGESVGKLEGFRFTREKGAAGAEDKAIKSAALQALVPHFHLRADRFYNAPDSEIDFTDQGGLMWGNVAVGKLVKGQDRLKPKITVFVDDVAGADVAQKVERRLSHFIDRKIAALFEPLIEIEKDEALSGAAKGFAFGMVEALGVISRNEVADEVKALDQEARGALRKHGIRFGQFTIFMPALLKPAPTRLRLVLWSVFEGFDVFPASPPPGLVTIPADIDAPAGSDLMAGYRNSGPRAIRIDMLERLADLLRAEDSRGGFECKSDMLSITGLSLEQFAQLMEGLGYSAERGERPKAARPAQSTQIEPSENAQPGPAENPELPKEDNPAQAEATVQVAPEPEAHELADAAQSPADAENDAPTADDTPTAEAPESSSDPQEPSIEVFYVFRWAGRGRRRSEQGPSRTRNASRKHAGGQAETSSRSGRKDRKGKPSKKPNKGAQKTQSFEARPSRKTKGIDPDNPFAAALMGLKSED